MNKKIAYILIIIFLLIILSLVSVMNFAIKNGGLYFYSGGYKSIVKEEIYDLEQIDNIDLKLKSSDVKFFVSENNELKIIQYGNNDSKEFEENKDSNSIQIIDNPINFMFFNFGNNSRYEVYLPNSYKGNLIVETVSGEITLNNFNLELKKIEIQSVSGDIELDSSFITKESKFKTVSGEITINKVNSDEIVLDTTSGDIEINNISSSDSNITTVSGEISLNYVSNMVKIKTTSGDVEINDLMINKDSKISTVSGEIGININRESNCIIKTDTLSGSVHIRNNNYQNGDYELDLKTTSGNIEIK